MRNGKYGVADKSKRTFYGKTFDSKKEGEEYLVALSEVQAGRIKDLKCQEPFVLLEEFEDANGLKHQKIQYFADFYFYDNRQRRYRVIDTKGMITDVFRLKRKLFNYKFKEQGLYIEDRI